MSLTSDQPMSFKAKLYKWRHLQSNYIDGKIYTDSAICLYYVFFSFSSRLLVIWQNSELNA